MGEPAYDAIFVISAIGSPRQIRSVISCSSGTGSITQTSSVMEKKVFLGDTVAGISLSPRRWREQRDGVAIIQRGFQP